MLTCQVDFVSLAEIVMYCKQKTPRDRRHLRFCFIKTPKSPLLKLVLPVMWLALTQLALAGLAVG